MEHSFSFNYLDWINKHKNIIFNSYPHLVKLHHREKSTIINNISNLYVLIKNANPAKNISNLTSIKKRTSPNIIWYFLRHSITKKNIKTIKTIDTWTIENINFIINLVKKPIFSFTILKKSIDTKDQI